MLSASSNGDQNVPEGYETLYVLTQGWNLTIIGVNTSPMFELEQTGVYRIHTLVYNPETLDLSIVEPGVTTGFDVNGLLVQGGGDICASLDVTGALYLVAPQWLCDLVNSLYHNATAQDVADLEKILDQGSEISADEIQNILERPAFAVSVFPNPVVDNLNLSIDAASDMSVMVSISDVSGRIIDQNTRVNATKGVTQTQINVSDLEAGMYNIVVTYGNFIQTTTFVKL